MEYKTDSSNNKYLETPLGWDDQLAKLRVTYIHNQDTVRLNKSDKANHIFPGPEFNLKYIPKLIEVLAKIYNDNNPNP